VHPIATPPHPVGPPIPFPVVAIVLAGGGAKGSFEVGAVRYLYDQGIRPNILCGTSVGAINAAKLAEGEGDPTRGLPGLESIWLGLKQNSDMYEKEPWLQSLMSDNPQLFSILPSSLFPSDPDPPGGHVIGTNTGTGIPGGNPFTAVAAAPIRFHAWLIEGLVKVETCTTACQVAQSIVDQSPKALYNLSPIEFLLAEHLNMALIQQWAATGGKLRLATVGLESGKVRYVTESGQLLDRDNGTLVWTFPIGPTDDPSCRGFADNVGKIVQEIEALGPKPPVDNPRFDKWSEQNSKLQDQLKAAKQILSACQQAHPQVPNLRPGVVASAALPCAFLPVKLGDENYVDGGIRDDMPVEMAALLGATVIYAVNDSPPLERDPESYDNKNLLDIAMRVTTAILVDEVVHEAETSVPNTGEVEVHEIRCTFAREQDTVTVHPALIRINMSYGYMRAADTLNPVPVRPKRCYELADDIIQLRRLLFQFEAAADTDLPLIRWGKGMLRLLLIERESLRGAIPQEIYESWLNWEQHVGWTPSTPTYLAAMNGFPAITNPNQFVPENGTLLQERAIASFGPVPPPGPIFLILGGAKFMVASPAELLALGLQAAPTNGVPVGSIQYLPDIPREGTLIKELTAPKVYRIQNGAKCWVVSPDVLRNYGGWAAVLTAPDGSLASIPNGPDLTS
jgi:predicted acylesterase/phospholipase RssA